MIIGIQVYEDREKEREMDGKWKNQTKPNISFVLVVCGTEVRQKRLPSLHLWWCKDTLFSSCFDAQLAGVIH